MTKSGHFLHPALPPDRRLAANVLYGLSHQQLQKQSRKI
jgi:hypothetical protein